MISCDLRINERSKFFTILQSIPTQVTKRINAHRCICTRVCECMHKGDAHMVSLHREYEIDTIARVDRSCVIGFFKVKLLLRRSFVLKGIKKKNFYKFSLYISDFPTYYAFLKIFFFSAPPSLLMDIIISDTYYKKILKITINKIITRFCHF